MGSRLIRWLAVNGWLAVYSLCAGTVATIGGMLAAAFARSPLSPGWAWVATTAVLTVLGIALAGPVLAWVELRRAGR
jgi:hypothetical protein